MTKAGQGEFGFEIHYCRKKLPGCVNCSRTQTLAFCRVKAFEREQLASGYPVVPSRLCFPLCACLVCVPFTVGGSPALVPGTHLLWNNNIQSVQGPLGSPCCSWVSAQGSKTSLLRDFSHNLWIHTFRKYPDFHSKTSQILSENASVSENSQCKAAWHPLESSLRGQCEECLAWTEKAKH